MGSKLYVGNLSYNTTGSDLEQLCAAHGTVASAEIIQDRETGRSKGFGFVQMGTDEEAKAAISALNGKEVEPTGRYRIVVNNYLASGGDSLSAFTAGTELTDRGIVDLDALVAWIEKGQTPPTPNRIRFVTTPKTSS